MFCLLFKKEMNQLCWDGLKRNTTQFFWDGGSTSVPYSVFGGMWGVLT